RKFLIAQYSYAPSDKFNAYLNYAGGQGLDSSRGDQFDVVLTSKLSDKFGLAYNGTINMSKERIDGKFGGSQDWWGSALYLNYDATDKLGLTLRNEYFSDADARLMFTGIQGGGNIFATTLSANIHIGNCFALIPEVRVDNASQNIFLKNNGAGSKSAVSALVAAVFAW
ncbi:MAG TPA: outer membrane beta-barrel protein, partial [Phnomibacter sp.]|nr:outer membrane beta-barrel protein [Phnomibacter sp.]